MTPATKERRRKRALEQSRKNAANPKRRKHGRPR